MQMLYPKREEVYHDEVWLDVDSQSTVDECSWLSVINCRMEWMQMQLTKGSKYQTCSVEMPEYYVVQDDNEVAFQCCVHSAEADEDHYIRKG